MSVVFRLRTLFFILAFLAPWRLHSSSKPNIVLITIDTLRADHLGCYGYKLATSPNIDRFAKNAITFQNAYSAVPLTLPSHATILSGVYPEHHGIRDNAHFAWKNVPLLQEILKRNGYNTAAFVSGVPLLSGFGLNRGFDVYDDQFDGAERHADQTTIRVLQWLKGARQPYFLWIHYYDPHAEYEPPAEYRKKFAAPYDGEIAFVDSQISKIFSTVDSGSLVVVTADHGESLGEHGETTHAVFVYNATLHVPLFIRAPGLSPAKRTDPVSLADVTPTILDYAGLKNGGSSFDGVSVKKESVNRTLLAESLYAQRNYGYAPLFASIRSGKKFIEAPQEEFYDLAGDPKELKNVIKQNKIDDWKRAVLSYAKPMASQQTSISPEEQEKLRSLGYVSGSVIQTGADPKTKIQIMERFRLGMVMLKKEQYFLAETRFREITVTEKQNGLAFRFLGDALSAQQKYAEAANAYSASLEKLRDPEVGVQLAKCYNKLQQPQKAEQALLDTTKNFPQYDEAAFELASFYVGQKNWSKALSLLNRDQPEFHNQHGFIYLNLGNFSGAVNEFRAALRGKEKATYWNNLGIAYQRSNRISEAENAYRRALELDPQYAECEANLSFLLIAQKKWDDAAPHLESITSRNPKLWRARMALGYVREAQGRSQDAVLIYKKLLTEAPKDWAERGQVEARLRELSRQ
jgi:choline-sulfatase